MKKKAKTPTEQYGERLLKLNMLKNGKGRGGKQGKHSHSPDIAHEAGKSHKDLQLERSGRDRRIASTPVAENWQKTNR